MARIGFVYNKNKKSNRNFFLLIKERYQEKHEIVVENFHENKIDFIVSIGGDGTLIKGSKKIIDMEVPVVAVNMGTLGFLTEIKKEEAFDTIDSVIEENYDLMERYFLKLRFKSKTYYVLNEVVIAKSGTLSRMIKVSINAGEVPINTYRADGLIIATPTGSTAYSMSAGGPIVTPDLDIMIITPISPHTLSNRPIVINGNENLFAEISERHDDAHIILDGQESFPIEKGEILKITLSSKKILLVKPKNRNYYSVLREKLNWGIENVKRIED
ncbi:MAG: NAD(+)/NADH kinase [Fusobacteriota bacterium]